MMTMKMTMMMEMQVEIVNMTVPATDKTLLLVIVMVNLGDRINFGSGDNGSHCTQESSAISKENSISCIAA